MIGVLSSKPALHILDGIHGRTRSRRHETHPPSDRLLPALAGAGEKDSGYVDYSSYVVDPGRALTLPVGARCGADAAYSFWARSSFPATRKNAYFRDIDLAWDGKYCIAPPACNAWACPKPIPDKLRERFYPPYMDSKEWKRHVEARSALDAGASAAIKQRQAAYAATPQGTGRLVRGGQVLHTGSFTDLLARARTGDRLELGAGTFPIAGLRNAPDSLTIIGAGPQTVLRNEAEPGGQPTALAAKGHWFQDLTFENPLFESALYARGRTLVFVRVNFDFYDFNTSGRSLDSIVTILGSFGVLSPYSIHELPARAFGTHVTTLTMDGEMADQYALPATLPDGPLRQWLTEQRPQAKGMRVDKALKQAPWKSLPAPDEATAQLIARWAAPEGTDLGTQLAVSAIKSWLSPGSSGVDNDPAVAVIRGDLEAKRFLSAAIRAAGTRSSDYLVADQMVSLRSEAMQQLSREFACDIRVTPDIKRRGPQNVALRWENEGYDDALYKLQQVDLDTAYRKLVPAAALATTWDRRCRYHVVIGTDVWQQEKTLTSDVQLEKSERVLSEQGMAKAKAASQAAMDRLGNIGSAFQAAAGSMQRSWQDFEAYRTRIVTTQTGDQYLVSYEGDRNASGPNPFSQLEAARRQSGAGPDGSGDYVTVATYSVSANRRFRHWIEYELKGETDNTQDWTSGKRVIDRTWNGSPCRDRFIDNGSVVVSANDTDCFNSAGYEGINALRQAAVAGLQDYTRQHVLTRLDARLSNLRRTGTPADAAEAALQALTMEKPLTPADQAALKKVFGNDMTPEKAKALLASAAGATK